MLFLAQSLEKYIRNLTILLGRYSHTWCIKCIRDSAILLGRYHTWCIKYIRDSAVSLGRYSHTWCIKYIRDLSLIRSLFTYLNI